MRKRGLEHLHEEIISSFKTTNFSPQFRHLYSIFSGEIYPGFTKPFFMYILGNT